jgi:hypothetical protein
MDSNKIKVILITVIAMVIALYLGISAATAQLETIAWVLGVGTLVVCISLGRRIWLLIPFLGALNVTLRLPGLPTSILIAQSLFLGFAVLLVLMRKFPFRFRFTELEFWTLILFLCVLQVYLRNPVNISLFGGDTVGGRPYVVVLISLVSSAFLFGLQVPPIELWRSFKLSILGGILYFILQVFGFFVPSIGLWYGAAGVSTNDTGTAANPERASRIGFLGHTAKNLSLWICCKMSPLQALGRPVWIGLILVSLAFAAGSGFRNTVVAVGFTYICGLIYRGGSNHLVASIFLGLLSIILLAFINVTTPLPPNIQRSLSFLPGTWDEDIERDAQGSSEWRFEIWREVLLTDRWIQNKYLGDGLGFSARELATQMNLRDAKRIQSVSGFDAHRETILASGDYHSGPVQTIRTIGYIGLAALLIAMFRLAVHAHRQIQRCRGTEWFPLALFIGIPLVWGPVFFVLVFGSFQTGITSFLMGAAMIRMMQNNLPLPAYVPRSRYYIPLATAAAARSQ